MRIMRFREFVTEQAQQSQVPLDNTTQRKVQDLTLQFLKTLNDGQVTNIKGAMAYTINLLAGKDPSFNQRLNTEISSQTKGTTQANPATLPDTPANLQTPEQPIDAPAQANPQGFTR